MPWASTLGESRVYAYTGRPFTADAWFKAFKQGRTFVTNGPMLSITANGAGPGEEVKISGQGTVRIRARAWAPPIIGSPKTLEVVSQGEVIRVATSSNPSDRELEIDVELPVQRSRWIAARVTTDNDGLAHTSPVYVNVDGQRFWNVEQVPVLVRKRLEILDYGQQRLKDVKYTASFASGEIEALGARIADARRRYEELLAAAAR
jgi:hypothetical protein